MHMMVLPLQNYILCRCVYLQEMNKLEYSPKWNGSLKIPSNHFGDLTNFKNSLLDTKYSCCDSQDVDFIKLRIQLCQTILKNLYFVTLFFVAIRRLTYQSIPTLVHNVPTTLYPYYLRKEPVYSIVNLRGLLCIPISDHYLNLAQILITIYYPW